MREVNGFVDVDVPSSSPIRNQSQLKIIDDMGPVVTFVTFTRETTAKSFGGLLSL